MAHLPRRAPLRRGRDGLLSRADRAPARDAARRPAGRWKRGTLDHAPGAANRRAAGRGRSLHGFRRWLRGCVRRGDVRRLGIPDVTDAGRRRAAGAAGAPLPPRSHGRGRARLAHASTAADHGRNGDRAPRHRLHRDAHLQRDPAPRAQAELLRRPCNAAGDRLDRRWLDRGRGPRRFGDVRTVGIGIGLFGLCGLLLAVHSARGRDRRLRRCRARNRLGDRRVQYLDPDTDAPRDPRASGCGLRALALDGANDLDRNRRSPLDARRLSDPARRDGRVVAASAAYMLTRGDAAPAAVAEQPTA